MRSQHNGLLVVLGHAEKRVKTLRDSIQDVVTLRLELFIRWHNLALLRRDLDVSKASTVLALEMVEMIKVIQGRVQNTKPLIEVSR